MVEFALILPLLMIILGGIIDFGRAYHQQVVLTNAAREGARMAALGYTWAEVQDRVDTAVTGLNGGATVTAVTAFPCVSDQDAVVSVAPNQPFGWTILDALPGVPTPVLDAEGSMRCFG